MAAYPLRLIAETLCTRYVLVLILPIIVLVVFAVRGTLVDPEISNFLGSPTVLEKYKQANGVDPNDRREEMSPLVKQAGLFAQYLDPARVPKGVGPAIRAVGPVAPSPNFPAHTAKFTLHGTCYYPSRPEESIALVWQPGGGGGTFEWVKQGARLGHFVVDEIKRGSIIYRGGAQKHEVKVQRSPAQGNLVRGHRTDPGRAGNGSEALEPVAVNNKRLLAEAGTEEETASEDVSERHSQSQLGFKPP
ncbi:MAG: hypothetical protein ACYTE3_02500 [Planctomycetota bacterium]